MTYEERKRWLCQQCGKPHQCGYVNRGLEDDCTALQEKMEGWELGHADAIEEACDFFEARMWEMCAPDDNYIVVDGYSKSKKEFIEQFKEYLIERK